MRIPISRVRRAIELVSIPWRPIETNIADPIAIQLQEQRQQAGCSLAIYNSTRPQKMEGRSPRRRKRDILGHVKCNRDTSGVFEEVIFQCSVAISYRGASERHIRVYLP